MKQFVFASAAVCALSLRADATNYTSIGSGNWNAPGTWYPSGVPGCGDAVFIDGNDTVTLTDQRQVSSVIVLSGHLVLEGTSSSTARLTFCSSEAPGLVISSPSGVVLANGYTDLRFLMSMTITGSGDLEGRSSNASITLDTGQGKQLSLQSNVSIHGALVIKADGTGKGFFCNGGGVAARRAGEVLCLHSSLAGITDTGFPDCVPRWSVDKYGASLRFERSALLARSFYVGPGTLSLTSPVSTAGGLRLKQGGGISLAPSAYFSFAGHCESDCWWVPPPVSASVRCD